MSSFAPLISNFKAGWIPTVQNQILENNSGETTGMSLVFSQNCIKVSGSGTLHSLAEIRGLYLSCTGSPYLLKGRRRSTLKTKNSSLANHPDMKSQNTIQSTWMDGDSFFKLTQGRWRTKTAGREQGFENPKTHRADLSHSGNLHISSA